MKYLNLTGLEHLLEKIKGFTQRVIYTTKSDFEQTVAAAEENDRIIVTDEDDGLELKVCQTMDEIKANTDTSALAGATAVKELWEDKIKMATFTQAGLKVAGGWAGNIYSENVGLEGYTAEIVNVKIDNGPGGTRGSYLTVYGNNIEEGVAYVFARNSNSSEATIQVAITVLYIKE